MKKLVTLLLAAGLVFSAANSASAVEVKASGTMNFAFDWGQSVDKATAFRDADDAANNTGDTLNQKHFDAVQRMRLTLDFVMSENLSATYQAQVGIFTWGGPAEGYAGGSYTALGGNSNEGLGGALGTRSANIVTRLAYLDWIIPSTSVKVRMGQQAVALPSFTFGSPVLDSTATGVVVASPITDNFGLTGMWLRANSGFRRGSGLLTDDSAINDNFDLVGLIADVKGDGFKVQPWVTVGFIGKESGFTGRNRFSNYGLTLGEENTQGYKDTLKFLNALTGTTLFDPKAGNATAVWAGISGELTMFDPFRLTADFIYNNAETEHSKAEDTNGWYAALGAEYKTAYGTPALKGWYASGDDDMRKKDEEGGRVWEIDGGFDATTTFYDGCFPITRHMGFTSPEGSWGIQAAWNDISFIENLSHALSVTYVQGTNNKHNQLNPATGYLTTKDSFVELDFTTVYNIYQNLAAALELGYIFEDFDGKNAYNNLSNEARAKVTGDKLKYSNAWRASLAFQYKF